jgi:tRNA-uridine 2-sulfurtransferase
MNGKTVFVGLSGGVDSSVAALRLIKSGYNVVGVFIKVWHPDFLVCNWEQERLDAMRVAAHLDIPFLTCDAEAAYRDEVAYYFINEYIKGNTPNPDIMCNKHVKFGTFLKFAKSKGADYIATGHYAQKITSEGDAQLHRGLDKNKDQSYFLYSLSKEQLSYTLLPVGNTTKDIIRKEATKAGIPTATKKDSQGVCFLGHIDIKDFLSHYTDLSPGNVLSESGEVIGQHDGALIYTIGQRHGFSIDTKSASRSTFYVTRKNLTTNTITVSEIKPKTHISKEILLTSTIVRDKIFVGETYEAQTRYRQKPFLVKVTSIAFDNITLEALETTEAPAIGQSCVLYKGLHCLGGGIIA